MRHIGTMTFLLALAAAPLTAQEPAHPAHPAPAEPAKGAMMDHMMPMMKEMMAP